MHYHTSAMMYLSYLSVKPIYFDEETRPDELNYVTYDESERQVPTDEVPKSPKGPPPDNNKT